jgi:hypothetical protein
MVGLVVSGWELELGCKRESRYAKNTILANVTNHHRLALSLNIDFSTRRETGLSATQLKVMGKTILRVLKPRPTGPWPLSAVTVNFDPSRGAAAELKVREKKRKRKRKRQHHAKHTLSTPYQHTTLRYEPMLNSSLKYK